MNSTLSLAVFRAPQFVQTLEAVKLRCGVKQGLDTQHSNTNCITLGRSLKETAPIIIFFGSHLLNLRCPTFIASLLCSWYWKQRNEIDGAPELESGPGSPGLALTGGVQPVCLSSFWDRNPSNFRQGAAGTVQPTL